MGELRRDPVGGRWVIVETESPLLPENFEKEEHHWKGEGCPFCYGNESETPPEIDAIRDPKTKPNTPGWQVRVVSNKFPQLVKFIIPVGALYVTVFAVPQSTTILLFVACSL